MKKTLTFLLILVLLQSCKEKTDIQVTRETKTTLEDTVQSKKDSVLQHSSSVYNGLGTFDSSGKFIYHISLPKEGAHPYKFKLFNVNNETLFIHLDSGSKDELTNTANNVYLLEGTLPKDTNSSPYKPKYNVFLWHDDAAVNNATEARNIMHNPADSLVAPKKVGIGILSLK